MNKKVESRFYSSLGQVTLLAVIILVLYHLFKVDYDKNEVSKIEGESAQCQQSTCLGIDVKENTPTFKSFLNRIKLNDGVLILGTSETGAFKNENYHGILNEYYNLDTRFSVLAGAGRSCHIYFPTILNNKEAFKGLKIMYFINPTYWRPGLNEFHMGYYERYNDWAQIFKVKSELEERGLYEEYAKPLIRNISIDSSILLTSKIYLDPFRYSLQSIFERMHSTLVNESDKKVEADEFTLNFGGECVTEFKGYLKDSTLLMDLLSEVDTVTNSTDKYGYKLDPAFVSIKESNFQYKALEAFIDLCEESEIELVCFLGPYNAIYCDHFSPEWKPDHEFVMKSIKEILETKNVTYVDGSDLSYLPGSFNDKQHHSKYAAWLIADRLANYYEKNK